MIATPKAVSQTAQCHQDDAFLKLVPAIRKHAHISFRHLRTHEREEAIAEVLCHAYLTYRRLAERGKLDLMYATPLARYGVARVCAGRYAASRLTSKDVYARQAQRHAGFRVVSLESNDPGSGLWAEILADDTLTPVPDQVAFRLEFGSWLADLKRRDRKLVRFLAAGNTPSEAAGRFGISRARVSQLRRELRMGWESFAEK